MLALDAIQQIIVARAATQPTYLVDITWGGEEQRWSSRGDHVVDGVSYTGGQVSVRGAANWRTAGLAIVPTAENTAVMLSGDWVGAACDISLLPVMYHPQILEEGYVEDGYGFFGTEVGDRILLLRGVIAAAEYSGDGPITLEIRHATTVGKWAPRTLLAPPTANHLPAPGTKFTWAGEVYILEAR